MEARNSLLAVLAASAASFALTNVPGLFFDFRLQGPGVVILMFLDSLVTALCFLQHLLMLGLQNLKFAIELVFSGC